MRGASQRMTSVFNGLQDLFRLTGGEVHREEIDVTALCREIVREIKAGAPDSGVKFEIAPGMTASGDRRLVRVLLSNLLGNALKFARVKPNPRVEVGTEIVDGESRIFVRDNGVGFDMIYAYRLFGAFQRLHSQSEFPGAGIGLATARRIVNRHGGRIWAEGAEGEGATFYFVI
jgi:light-regulated signal transduction histidine kinase (bacteriophytochrome)